jgi:hypothetical protein
MLRNAGLKQTPGDLLRAFKKAGYLRSNATRCGRLVVEGLVLLIELILAKVYRDAIIAGISKKMGEDVGSGYLNDPVTIEFLRSYYQKHRKMPDCARKSWKTTGAIIDDCLQARLFQF